MVFFELYKNTYVILESGTVVCGVEEEGKESVSLGLNLDYILVKMIRLMKEKREKRKILFYQYVSQNDNFILVDENLISVGSECIQNGTFELLLDMEVDPAAFDPVISNRNVFNYHESANVPCDLDRFWNYPMKKQLWSFSQLKNDPFQAAVHLISMMAKTNSDCFGDFKMDYKKDYWGFIFYKICNQSCIVFGFGGSDSYKRQAIIEFEENIKRHHVGYIDFPSDQMVPIPLLKTMNYHEEGKRCIFTRFVKNAKILFKFGNGKLKLVNLDGNEDLNEPFEEETKMESRYSNGAYFASEKQRRYLWSHEPRVAKELEHESGHDSKHRPHHEIYGTSQKSSSQIQSHVSMDTQNRVEDYVYTK